METIHTIKNESGSFHMDENGVMLEYVCNPENIGSLLNIYEQLQRKAELVD